MRIIRRQNLSGPARPRESGTIIVVLLILISLLSVITVGSSHSLARLRMAVLGLEQRHAARTEPGPVPAILETASPTRTAPAAETPGPDQPHEPPR